MKGKGIFLFAVGLLLLLTACGKQSAKSVIGELNENTDLPFSLALPEKELEYGDDFTRQEGFGGYTIGKDGLLIWVAGWPDVLDTYHVMEYRVTDPGYFVFGFSVGGEAAAAEERLTRLGYRQTETEGSRKVYRKGDAVALSLFCAQDGTLSELWITAVTTNKEGAVF